MSEQTPVPAPDKRPTDAGARRPDAEQTVQGTPAAGRAMRDLAPRLLSAVVMIALAFVTLWAGGQVFVLFWMLAAFAVFWEWQRMIKAKALMVRLFLGAAALAIGAALSSTGSSDIAVVVIVLAAAAIAVAGSRQQGEWVEAVWAAAGMVYAGGLLISVLMLRMSLLEGVTAILWLFAIVWGTDILAYFSGRSIGGPKLWPQVSPSKTWSGFVGGVTGGALCGTLLAYVMLPGVQAHLFWMFLFGLILAIVSQAGDLFESTIKRRYGVKDSSQLIPGHGGAMDRLDGFITAVICAALIGAMRGGQLGAAHGLFQW